MVRSNDPETRAQKLSEELNAELNRDFESHDDYREAVETVLSYFESVRDGLLADEENEDQESVDDNEEEDKEEDDADL